jgi:hypothetical protein
MVVLIAAEKKKNKKGRDSPLLERLLPGAMPGFFLPNFFGVCGPNPLPTPQALLEGGGPEMHKSCYIP